MSDQEATTDLPDEYKLYLPPEWVEFDLTAADAIDQAGSFLQDRLGDEYDNPASRVFEAMLRKALVEAMAGGVVLAGAYADVDSEGGEPSILSATATVALRSTPGGMAIGPDLIEQLFAPDGDAAPDRSVASVDLSVGPVIRIAETRTVQLEDWPQAGQFFTVQFFIPTPSGTGLAILTFTTPTLPLADGFSDLFDVIAESFEYVWEPTEGVQGT